MVGWDQGSVKYRSFAQYPNPGVTISQEVSAKLWGPCLPDVMNDTSKKSPMELINEVPPIKVEARIVACEGDTNPALGHPIEFICLDLKEPAVCKYCGLRYVQDHHH
ncbi:NADH dehydrogenase [ubiquinone] iron-sulfur protein 6, mitochondrial [Vitis vinifera]|uniref:NADH dehydrogenase [ubiquinone] iron-sulfur protein 6, mitochondrial n=1 Tax=Vitis vinifera TaxID=29760 RepID=A0A438IYG5_VITVI|nr:NADH dehydrogenase [ubiquinone] iron-sulfur protein 6, mitochondrial [Vitis vinifera]RVX01761.1 NADH dehydrogenase [ubiquinone] iron-sulfur protein 6, mitochondrial [Vitis vinifera]